MKTVKILLIVALLGAATGCPKRQTSLRLVYAPPPAPPPASTQASQHQVLVIESPPPPKPAAPAPKPAPVESAEPAPAPQPEHHETPSVPPVPVPEPVQTTTTADAPQLQPLRSPQEQAALEQQVKGLKSGVEGRIGRLSHLSLSSADRKALDDARAFLSQADQATKQGDLQEAMNFAQKADLLIAAIEKRY